MKRYSIQRSILTLAILIMGISRITASEVRNMGASADPTTETPDTVDSITPQSTYKQRQKELKQREKAIKKDEKALKKAYKKKQKDTAYQAEKERLHRERERLKNDMIALQTFYLEMQQSELK